MMVRLGSRLMLTAFIALLAAAVSGFDFSQIENKVVEYELDNGLTVLVLPQHDVPTAAMITLVNAGGCDDPKGAAGISHMLEHMAFKGTEEIGTTNIEREKYWMAEEDRIFDLILEERARLDQADSARLAELDSLFQIATDSASAYVITNEFGKIYEEEGGVGLNAGTGYDITMYFAEYPANRLELWMAMESDRFLSPVFRSLFQEKQVVAEERRMTRESTPQGKLQEEFMAAAFMAHPYGRSLIGPMSDIQNYNRHVLRDHFSKYYVPSNMAIAIVGDVDPEKVHDLAQEYFGRIPPAPEPKPVMTIEAEPYGQRTTVVRDQSQPMLFCGFHIPDGDHPDMTAIDAMAKYLGQGRTSRLHKKLVKEEQIAVYSSAFAGWPGSKYPCLLMFVSVPAKDHTNTENDEAILEEIEKVKNELISPEELEKIKARAKADFINNLKSNKGMAMQLAYYELVNGDWQKLFRELDKVNALTPEDIKRVANEYLDVDRRIVGLLENVDE